MKILTIIVPVYNVQKYLQATLDSLKTAFADKNDVEIIFINDGSTDCSQKILENNILKFSNALLIKQKNKGLSLARNIGLERAKGTYVWFVDSDDMVTIDSYSTIVNIVKQANYNIIGFDILEKDEKTSLCRLFPVVWEKYYLQRNCVHNIKKAFEKIAICPVQRFLFKKSFLNDNQLEFYPNIYHEDRQFMVRALLYSNDIYITDRCIYIYLKRVSGNIMSNKTMKTVESKMTIIDSFEDLKKNMSILSFSYNYLNCAQLSTLRLLLAQNKIIERNKEFNYIKRNSNKIRKVALEGLFSSLYFLQLKTVLKALVILLSPWLYLKIISKN